MDITPLGKDAFAIMAMCGKTRKPFAITVNPEGRRLNFIWAFPIDKEKAHRERLDEKKANGQVCYDSNFPGCPHCKCHDFYKCESCGYVICWSGDKRVTCPNCGKSGEVGFAESFSFNGGGI